MSQQASSANGFTSNTKTRENALSQAKFQLGKVLRMPIAHGEGRLLFPKRKRTKMLEKLIDEDMIVFRYCDKDGNVADGKYPTNPNGSLLRHRRHMQQGRKHFRLDASS